MPDNDSSMVFNYRTLRLIVGIIAFALPFTVSLVSSSSLTSISASYYTEARDAFVGMLFVVGAFLFAYNGHSVYQAWASKVAAVAAIFVAICPTSCDNCDVTTTSTIHYVAAAILFLILAYFCFGPFRTNTKGQGGKKGLRSKIYFICGSVIVASMLSLVITKLTTLDDKLHVISYTYWAEAVSLCAFGFAWFVAGKYFSIFVDKKEGLRVLL